MRFRKNPVEFEAVQWQSDNLEEMRAFVGTRTVDNHAIINFNPINTYLKAEKASMVESGWGELWVDANQAWLPIEPGEWVVQDSLGFYPCKNEIMEKNNTPVTDDHV